MLFYTKKNRYRTLNKLVQYQQGSSNKIPWIDHKKQVELE